MPYAAELGYIAGVIDSDGYIGLVRVKENRRKRRTESYSSRVQVRQCKTEAIELIHELYGGRLWEMPAHDNHRALPQVLIASRAEVKRILNDVLPHLRIKRRQAEVVLEFVAIREARLATKKSSKFTYGSEEKELWRAILALNKAGRV